MNPILIVAIVIFALMLGVVLALYLHPNRHALREREAKLAEVNTKLSESQNMLHESHRECGTLASENARLEERVRGCEKDAEELKALRERVVVLESEKAGLEERIRQEGEQRKTLREESEKSFRELASAIMDEKSRTFKQSNEERLGEILRPFRENVEGLQKKIDEHYANEKGNVIALEKSIKELSELNYSISREARELTEALKGNSKVQGDWGEMILKQILEKSGLEEGVNFTVQATTNADGTKIVGEENNQLRPDVIFHLPEGKNIVIDSKVSIKHYVAYVNATDEAERTAALESHLASVAMHVKELTTKQYQLYVTDAADFVLMFIPNEGAYMAAMNGDPTLWQRAYDQHVVIISPTHLISVLKLMYQLWTRDKQTKNALLIAEETGKLYDKICGFVGDLEDLGKSLSKASSCYENAYSKLSTGRGNILGKVERIKKLGIKTSKRLPQEIEADDEE